MGSLQRDGRSVHSDGIEEVHNVPVDVIIRPLPPVLDESKVQSLVNAIRVRLTQKHAWTPRTPTLFPRLMCCGLRVSAEEITSTRLEDVTASRLISV
ncbi:uncharacterized protein srxn1 isoform X2 [Denticeps clupeoides]|uniref:uncharacterized protein srxn1 isoform X2 n=1 Tax=Denticeps clupeoides TaxID=299321 RepID=UPI0010A55CAF|nr:sulfiredoxin-1 isoform X2 [Denticeps clupeoides]